MASVVRVHSSGTAALWASGTSGDHVATSTRLHVTGDCAISRTPERVMIGTQFHAVGVHAVGAAVRQHIDQRYIVIVSGRAHATSSAGQHVRAWERDARTGGRWRAIAIEALTPRPVYFLGNMGLCPNDRVITLIAPARFRYVGAGVVDGLPVWHLRGTRTNGDTTTLDLYVDQSSYRWIRVKTAFTIRNNGEVVNRIPSTLDYSRFNGPIRIGPPSTRVDMKPRRLLAGIRRGDQEGEEACPGRWTCFT